MGITEGTWSVISFMIFMMTISISNRNRLMHTDKLDPIGNNIKLEGTRSIHPYKKPG